MRIAVKYSMVDVQVVITMAIQITPRPQLGLRTEIARLAFVAEFPSYFSKAFAIQTFRDASAIQYSPTASDIRPLMVHPDLVVLMMQYREGLAKPEGAPWKRSKHGEVGRWLDTQFSFYTFKPQA